MNPLQEEPKEPMKKKLTAKAWEGIAKGLQEIKEIISKPHSGPCPCEWCASSPCVCGHGAKTHGTERCLYLGCECKEYKKQKNNERNISRY